MIHLLSRLPCGARVLDLGAAAGSFPSVRDDVCVVRLDLKFDSAGASGCLVRGDAARLPFADGVFDLLVSNHSLEHFVELEAVVREMGRVARPGAGLYVAVPDAATLTDRIYRWMGRGGGHVNPFRTPAEVIALIERLTGLAHRSTLALYSSLSFLNAHSLRCRPPRKLLLFANGDERFLAVLLWSLRTMDRVFGSGLSRYGWEFHFGAADPGEAREPWVNVCVRCGSGQSEAYLRKHASGWRKFGPVESYHCPGCGGFNLLSPELDPAKRYTPRQP
ncbi:MAG: methyltransferase domain-containing protein [Bryobacteraceae bacterium]|jgi:SAM-dependent methyltransferase